MKRGLPTLVFVALLACDSATDAGWPPLPPTARPVEVVAVDEFTSYASGFVQPTHLVIRDATGFQDAWQQVNGNVAPMPTPPDIDFTQHMLVVAAMGQRPTGGYSISIDGVYTNGAELIVRVLETSPGTDCVVPQALTQPVTAVLVPRSDAEALFQTRQETIHC